MSTRCQRISQRRIQPESGLPPCSNRWYQKLRHGIQWIRPSASGEYALVTCCPKPSIKMRNRAVFVEQQEFDTYIKTVAGEICWLMIFFKQVDKSINFQIGGLVYSAFGGDKNNLIIAAFAHPEYEIRNEARIIVGIAVVLRNMDFVQIFVDLAEHPCIPFRCIFTQPFLQSVEEINLTLLFDNMLEDISVVRILHHKGQIIVLLHMLDSQVAVS